MLEHNSVRAYPPVYKGTLEQAMGERDVDAYLDSRKLNIDCKNAIEQAIAGSGMFSNLLFTASHVNEKMPSNLPRTRAMNTLSVTPSISARVKCSKEMLALAKAKRGITM